jgi:hypothetical protein
VDAFEQNASPPDPLLGSWTLNVSLSKYEPGPAPTSVRLTFATDGDWATEALEIVDADSRHSVLGLRGRYDGKDYPLIGTAAATVVLVREDAYTTKSIVRENGRLLATYRRSVSEDGQILTVIQTGTNANGERFNNTAVYQREGSRLT